MANSRRVKNLHLIEHPFFRAALEERVQMYLEHFGDRLVSVSVKGSVHRGEAVRGASDLDLINYTADNARNERDMAWRHKVSRAWKARYGDEAHGFNPPRCVDEINKRPAFKWTLRYDSTLVYGDDLIAGEEIAPPVFGFGEEWRLARHAADLEPENNTDFVLPQRPDYRLRKLARLGVLVGASVQMHAARFRSFRGVDILPDLQRRYPDWTAFIQRTAGLYIHPAPASEREVEKYLRDLLSWMDWAGDKIGQPYNPG